MILRSLSRILLVEDEADIQLVARLALESLGAFEVALCSSGQEALEVAPRYRPDLVLLDVMMPGLDGPATLEALRRLPDFEMPPVVFVTAKVQAVEIERYKAMGALDVIGKPFDPLTLSDKVRSIWETYHRQRDAAAH